MFRFASFHSIQMLAIGSFESLLACDILVTKYSKIIDHNLLETHVADVKILNFAWIWHLIRYEAMDLESVSLVSFL